MPLISRNALVPYSTEEMYKLVADIEDYPKFLPWCRSTQVMSRTDQEVKASIEIARGALNKSFTTLNRMQPGKIIEMRLVQGPFKHLQGFWRFDELKTQLITPGACKISFDLDFEFESKLVAMVAGPVFNQIANSMVEAFTKRAIEVYGERTI